MKNCFKDWSQSIWNVIYKHNLVWLLLDPILLRLMEIMNDGSNEVVRNPILEALTQNTCSSLKNLAGSGFQANFLSHSTYSQ